MGRYRSGVCSCAGTAPGYPQHEPDCDLVTGQDTAAREAAEAAASPTRWTGPTDAWATVAAQGGVNWTSPEPF